MLAEYRYCFSPEVRQAFDAYPRKRMRQPRFANARSVRNALGRARLRQAKRLLVKGGGVTTAELMTFESEDVLASRVFTLETPDMAHDLHVSEGRSLNKDHTR